MKIKKTASILLIGFLTTFLHAQIIVTIDTTLTHQTIFGFGGSLKRYTQDLYTSDTNTINQIENLCFNELKINMIRVMCHPSIEFTNDNSNPFLLDTAQLYWGYYENTTKDIHAIRRALLRSNNRINHITASNNSAPSWQKSNNSMIWGDTIRPTMYNEFTEYLTAFLRGMKSRYNITINSISPFNEPGVATFYESLSSSRNQVKNIVISLRQRLDALENINLLHSVDIVSPDCIAVSDTSYIPPNIYFNIGDLSTKNTIYFLDASNNGMFSDTTAVNSIDIVGTHNYIDLNNTANWSSLKNVGKDKPIWITEVSTVNSPDFDSENAVLYAKWIHRSLTEGNATAFLLHALYEPLVNGKTSGLLTWDSNGVIIPKRFYGFKQFVNFVKSGYVRVNVVDNDSRLYTSGYINSTNDTLVVVAINDANIELSDITFLSPNSSSPISQFVTCDSPNYNTTQLVNISAPTNGSFITNLQAMSITTLVIPIDEPLGLKKATNGNDIYKVFPNPSKTQITIAGNIKPHTRYTITDIVGNKVQTGALNSDHTISVTGLLSGFYVVSIGGKSVKFIIEK